MSAVAAALMFLPSQRTVKSTAGDTMVMANWATEIPPYTPESPASSPMD